MYVEFHNIMQCMIIKNYMMQSFKISLEFMHNMMQSFMKRLDFFHKHHKEKT